MFKNIAELKSIVDHMVDYLWLEGQEKKLYSDFIKIQRMIEFKTFGLQEAYVMANALKANYHQREKILNFMSTSEMVKACFTRLGLLEGTDENEKSDFSFKLTPVERLQQIISILSEDAGTQEAVEEIKSLIQEVGSYNNPVVFLSHEGEHTVYQLGKTNENPHVDDYLDKINDALNELEDGYQDILKKIKVVNDRSDIVMQSIIFDDLDAETIYKLLNEFKALRASRRELRGVRREIEAYMQASLRISNIFSRCREEFCAEREANEKANRQAKAKFARCEKVEDAKLA